MTDKEICQSKQGQRSPPARPGGPAWSGGARGLAPGFCPFQWDELPSSFCTFYHFLTIPAFAASQRYQCHERVGARHG